MTDAESRLRYVLNDALPEPGSALDIAPGVKWIRMGLPFVLNHINLWLLRDSLEGKDGWTVVDCCVDTAAARAQWELVFATQLEGLPVLRVIATHMHPDHLGLAHWICEKWDVTLWISATDYYTALAATSGTLFPERSRLSDFYRSHGVTDMAFHDGLHERGGYYPALVPKLPPHFRRILGGDRITIGNRAFDCISGYGHAPEHMAFYCAGSNVLISGDMVLPRISTNVSVFAGEPESDPLALFLSSLGKFDVLPASTLVLPSHGKPFTGLHERLHQLKMHHVAQLRLTRQACENAAICALDLVPTLFKRSLDDQQLTFALGEALAHLHALWYQGELDRVRDADGVYRFTACASAR